MEVSIPEQVLFRDLDGESVLLHLGSGQYFGLDEVGTLIWNSLSEGCSLDEIERRILTEYDVSAQEAKADVRRLVDELTQSGLLEVKDSRNALSSTEP
ncbi:MAG: PqqD family protein [bacterium]|nr:PqqD family protein [bacterium]